MEKKEYIPMEECRKGFLYRIRSRNLDYGVYDGNGGFIGIRQKFGFRYLFTEDHWDTGPPFGTVKPLEELVKVPQFIEIRERIGNTYDKNTGREVYFDNTEVSGETVGWVFSDTDQRPEEGQKISPCTESNKKLFEWLDKQRDENEISD